MSNVLLSVLAATSLVTAGAPSETRSAQSLPAEHMVVPPAQPNSSGNFQSVNRLADATPGNAWSDQSPEIRCKHHAGHWIAEQQKCEPNLGVYVIGGAAVGGFVYAMTSRGGSSNGALPISN